MTAAEDLHRRRETETALNRLLDGRPYTRKGLFSRIERWQESLLRRLAIGGAINVTKQGRGKPVRYEMKDDVILQSLLDDEELLLQMVFPSYKPAPTIGEIDNVLPATSDDPPPDVAAQPIEPVQTETLQESLESSDVMSTEILLKLLIGMIEILNSHTEQLNTLSDKVEAIDSKVQTLLQELTG